MFFTGDNLVVIAGRDVSSPLNDVEHVSSQNNNNLCDPLDLDYTVYFHASVATDLGILTCGGVTASNTTSKCTLQTKNGQTTSFPSMRRSRWYFGLGIVNETIFAIGGRFGQQETTMEKINYNTDSEWTLTDLPFSVGIHCLTATTESLVITGGYDGEVSKKILSFVNENKMKIKERINQLQKKIICVS